MLIKELRLPSHFRLRKTINTEKYSLIQFNVTKFLNEEAKQKSLEIISEFGIKYPKYAETILKEYYEFIS